MKIIDKLLLKIKPVEIIRKSSFFDGAWYKEKYQIESDPAYHYLNEGWLKNYNPSIKFSTADYLINNPDIHNINPLLHYEVFGKNEGRKAFIPPLDDINNYNADSVGFDYESLCKHIADKKVVSFDVFDTLVNRPFIRPTQLFNYMQIMFGIDGFADKRIKAERDARKMLHKEVKLDEIYSFMDDDLRQYVKSETELEIKLCHSNQMIAQIYKHAKKHNKRVIAISDMYHGKETIEAILKKNGYQMDEIYVSCEYNMTKGQGDLYSEVMRKEDIGPEDIVHFGDNYLSDYSQARLMDIQAYQTPKSLDYFLNNKDNSGFLSYLKKYDNLSSSIHLSLISEYLNTDKHDYFEKLGYVFGGSLALGYLNFVCEDATKKGIDQLLFVSRDGYSLIEVYNRYLKDRYGIDYAYAYLSRAAVFSGTIENRLNIDIRKLLEIAQIQFNDIEVYDDEKRNLEEYEKHKDMIDEFSINRSSNLRKHLEQITEGHNNIATVDMVSGRFTSFKAAKYYLNDRARLGYFAGSFALKDEDKMFYCDRVLGVRDNLPVKLSELLISSYQSPIVGLDDQAKPIYEYDCDEKRRIRYQSIMKGVYQYCDDYLSLFEADNRLLLSFAEWLDITASYLYECPGEDIEKLSDVVDSENPVSRTSDRNFAELIEDFREKGY